MGKIFVSVAVPSALTAIPVAEYEEGASAFVASTLNRYILTKNRVPPPEGGIFPAAGSPIAGNPNAVWSPVT